MANIVDVEGATLQNSYLANNTKEYLTAHMELLKNAVSTDTKEFVYTDQLGAKNWLGGGQISPHLKFIETTFEGNTAIELHYSATGEFPGTVIATWTI